MVKLIFENECDHKTCNGGTPAGNDLLTGLPLYGGTHCVCSCHQREDRMTDDGTVKSETASRIMTLEEKINEMFTYHAPDPNQKVRYQNIREKAKEFARVIYENTPACADQSAAIRLVREAVMTANASIALRGLV
jgi:hypothetical protein